MPDRTTHRDEELISTFLDYCKNIKNYSEHTIDGYSQDINQFYSFLKKEHSQISSASELSIIHIRDWMTDLHIQKFNASTRKRKKSSLSSYFKFLLKKGVVTSNLVRNIPTPSLKKRIPHYLDAQAAGMIDETFFNIDLTAPWRDVNGKVFIAMLFSTGLRRAELCGLKESDISFAQKQVTVMGKGHKSRIVPIPQSLAGLLRDYLNARKELFPQYSEELLFVTHTGRAVYHEYINRLVKSQLSDMAAIGKKTPHVLRHTYATLLLNNGADLSAIKDLLGHSSLAATQVYTHTNIESLKRIFRKSHPRN